MSRVWVRETGKGMTSGWISMSKSQEVGKLKAKFRELSKGNRRRQCWRERQAGGGGGGLNGTGSKGVHRL